MPRTKSLNGFANPPIRARPGEFQIWELGNLGADAFFDMKLEGHEFWLIERDGNLLFRSGQAGHLFLPPGARATVVVQAGATPGRYALRSPQRRHRPGGRPQPDRAARHFHRLRRAGRRRSPILRAAARGPGRRRPGSSPTRTSCAKLKINRTRYVDFSESADGNTFFINNKTYKESRVDTTTRRGRVERWIVRNFSQEFTSSTCTRPSS